MRRKQVSEQVGRKRRPVIFIVAAVVNASHRQIMSGVVEYIDRHADWETIFFSAPADFERFCDLSPSVDADGLLAAPSMPTQLLAIRKARFPTVLMGLWGEWAAFRAVR